MEYLWALFVITALEGGDAKYTRLNTYMTREACEMSLAIAPVVYEMQDNETLMCIKVDE